jgi:transglutaminase-like putative cysteine protease
VLSPLVDIRSRLVNLSSTELFTVAATEPNYWRATALTIFDGSTWKLPDGDLASVSGAFAAAPPNSHEVTQQIHITGLGGSLLPAAYSPVRVDDGNVYWVDATGTLVVPRDGLQRADNYTIVSAVVDVPAADLSNATSLNPPAGMTDLPSDFPTSVSQAALAVTADATTVYDKALALQNWFRTQFAYDLSVQRGHSNDAIENFLRIRRGYCEQFSGAFAAMARSLGIPARVAVGFTPGDFQEDDRYHVYGRNAHAWPEVWFDNVGWVSFEPTPGRGQPGAQDHTGVEPQQATPDPGTADPTRTSAPTTTAGSDRPTTTLSDTPTRATTTTVAGRVAGGGGGSASGPPWFRILGIIALACLGWALILPFVLRRARALHHAASPADDIYRSWVRSTHALALLGVTLRPTDTPLEHAARAARLSELDSHALFELARSCTAAVYGGVGDAEKAKRSAELSNELVRAVKERLGTRERLLSRFDPRLARMLLTS